MRSLRALSLSARDQPASPEAAALGWATQLPSWEKSRTHLLSRRGSPRKVESQQGVTQGGGTAGALLEPEGGTQEGRGSWAESRRGEARRGRSSWAGPW